MKTKNLHLVVVFCFLGLLSINTVALNYNITFTGTGASSTVNSVIVQNLTKGTSVIVPAGNVLNLTDSPNAVVQVSANDETIRVYSTFVDGKSMVSFYAKQAGITQINTYSLDGRKVAGISTDLQAGRNTFELYLPKGVYLLQVTGNEYAYTAKLLNQTGTQGNPRIVYTSIDRPVSSDLQKTKSSTSDITTMTYTARDQLLYKGISGNYNTIVTDVPTGSKTTNFNFVACTDADGNNYTVVIIGSQTWMAENLKTKQYNDSTNIPNVTDNTWANLTTGAYCWYNNDAATNESIYGALYNWYTVNTGKLAPTGWHVPAHAEWSTLESFLIANGYNYDGTTAGDAYAMSLASAVNWATYTDTGSIGNDLTKNNRTGFSALPGGYRGTLGLLFGFNNAGSDGFWWSSTNSGTNTAWFRYLDYSGTSMGRYGKVHRESDGFSVRCVKTTLSFATLSTTAAFSSTPTTAMSGGNITTDGGAPIITSGVCWSTSANPTITDSKTIDGTEAGAFITSLTGLTPNTTYNIRAYATNSAGTAYGNQVSFTTNSPNMFTDRDGNIYHTVTIGTQTWMVENLKTTLYNDGTSIPIVTDNIVWGSLTTPGYCWYRNDSTYKNTFGALYNWYTVNTGKLAPTGWHVPTHAEWTTLGGYLTANGYNNDGSTLGDSHAKSLAAKTDWRVSTSLDAVGNDLSKNNRTGFSALPGGYRNGSGFYGANSVGWWWSSTVFDTNTAWDSGLSYDRSDVMYLPSIFEYNGFSVRCIKDN